LLRSPRFAGSSRQLPKMRLECVVADAEDAGGPALVTTAVVDHQPDVAAHPDTKRVVACERWPDGGGMPATHGRRQVVELNRLGLGERDDPFHHAFEFAHVAWPVVRDERIGDDRRQPKRPRRAVTRQEVFGQLYDVRSSLAQRRYADIDAAQAIEQIGPK